MAKKGKQASIREVALKVLFETRDSIQYGDLKKAVMRITQASDNSVDAAIWNLDALYPDQVFKPEKGLMRRIDAEDEIIEKETKSIETSPPKANSISEESFYRPFADWLQFDMNECTKAIPLGGSFFRDKWGTPDVIGIKESQRSDIVQALTEIVSAEIKYDDTRLIEAFGQACAYRIFSHKVYLVIPDSSSKDDKQRLDSLCQLFGIGYVLFDNADTDEPNFIIRVRPQKHEPDLFYTNRYLKLIEGKLF